MWKLPALPPSWDGFHPIVVHYPIALLATAPLFVVLALIVHRHRHPLNLAALILMALGAVGCWLAVSSGEAAEEWVDEVGAIKTILHDHEELAERAWQLTMILTPLFAAYTFIPWMMKRQPARKWTSLVGVILLIAWTAPILAVANAAHQGGRLVHEQGVRARLTGDVNPPAGAAAPRQDADNDD